jgi:hypothetical protein
MRIFAIRECMRRRVRTMTELQLLPNTSRPLRSKPDEARTHCTASDSSGPSQTFLPLSLPESPSSSLWTTMALARPQSLQTTPSKSPRSSRPTPSSSQDWLSQTNRLLHKYSARQSLNPVLLPSLPSDLNLFSRMSTFGRAEKHAVLFVYNWNP